MSSKGGGKKKEKDALEILEDNKKLADDQWKLEHKFRK
jgi:hypothetical protein